MRKKAKYTPAPKDLKKKVGDGGIPQYILKKCQEYLESNAVDFTPYAARDWEKLTSIRNKLTQKALPSQDAIAEITDIVMQLKSNGSMFQYQLISMISDVMLKFLENVQKTDMDFIDILDVYLKTLEIIVNKRLTGNGRHEGYMLTQELHYACQRYFTKHNIKV